MAVFFGGRSVEHDVSIITGNQIIENADKEKYNVFPVYIARDGQWFCGDVLRDTQYYKDFDPNDKKLTRVYLEPHPTKELKYATKFGTKVFAEIDVAMLAMHGMHAVSYTHLDVYKRQAVWHTPNCAGDESAGVSLKKRLYLSLIHIFGLFG